MQQVWDEENTEGFLLIDSSNIFNALNTRVALHNIPILYPRPAMAIINTYRIPSRLFIVGGGELQSQEGTTQGDPLAMPFYAISVVVLMSFLNAKLAEVKQVWLADDSTAAGKLCPLLSFLAMMISEGETYGYYVNTGKSCEGAMELFKVHDIKLTTEGERLSVSVVIGSTSFKEEYFDSKVSIWCNELERLSSIEKSRPHPTYSSFVHGYKHKFTYYMITFPTQHIYSSQSKISLAQSLYLPSLVKKSLYLKGRFLVYPHVTEVSGYPE